MNIIKFLFLLLLAVGVIQFSPLSASTQISTATEESEKFNSGTKVSEAKRKEGLALKITAIVVNFFIPFGVGSYIQGDYKVGITQSALDVTAIVCYILGGYGLASAQLDLYISGIALGVIFTFTAWLTGVIAPDFYYKKNYLIAFLNNQQHNYLPLINKYKMERNKEKLYNFNLYAYHF